MGKICRTSLLCFRKYIHVTLEQSSTMVRKYLKPSTEVTEKEPQKSKWIRSKGLSARLLWKVKARHFCFARWHVLQCDQSLRWALGKERASERTWIFEKEGWPSLEGLLD